MFEDTDFELCRHKLRDPSRHLLEHSTTQTSRNKTPLHDTFPSKSLFPSHLQLVHGNKQQPLFNFLPAFCNDSFYLSEFHQPKGGYEGKNTHWQSPSVKNATGNEPSWATENACSLTSTLQWVVEINPKGLLNGTPTPKTQGPLHKSPGSRWNFTIQKKHTSILSTRSWRACFPKKCNQREKLTNSIQYTRSFCFQNCILTCIQHCFKPFHFILVFFEVQSTTMPLPNSVGDSTFLGVQEWYLYPQRVRNWHENFR